MDMIIAEVSKVTIREGANPPTRYILRRPDGTVLMKPQIGKTVYWGHESLGNEAVAFATHLGAVRSGAIHDAKADVIQQTFE